MLALIELELGDDVAAPLRADAQRLAPLVGGIARQRLLGLPRGLFVAPLVKGDFGTERERGGGARIFLQQRGRDLFRFGDAPGVEILFGFFDARIGLRAPGRRSQDRQAEKKSEGGEAKLKDCAAKNVGPRSTIPRDF
jgi:hypothetical protein